MFRAGRERWTVALGLLLVASCAEPTEVLVHFEADEALATAASTMSVRVCTETGAPPCPYERRQPMTAVRFPATVPVRPGSEPRFFVEGVLEDEDGVALSTVSAVSGFVDGERTEIFLCFGCGDAGPTADAFVPPPDGGVPGDDAGGECDCACATDACVDGTCVPAVAIADVESAYDHTCAIDTEGGLWCWGANANGQLGVGDVELRDVPTRVSFGEPVLDVSTGEAHTCAVLGDGTLWCWGESQYARLGHELMDDQLSPIASCPGSDWAEVGLGGSHTCAIRSAGLACWGNNADGQLGIGATYSASDDCVLVSGDWSRFSAGHRHTCALRRSDDRLFCWGEHAQGRLAEGSPRLTDDQRSPFDASSSFAYAMLSLGFAHACAVERSGLLRCWGLNGDGRVGAGDWADPPYQVQLGEESDWVLAAAGGRHTCGIRMLDGGSIWCWGYAADGQLGVAGATGGSVPVRVEGTGFTDVSAGREHTCAVRDDGTLWCWGRNAFGQLGLADRVNRPTPTRTCF